MAIKISGNTVIDDSRNFCNIVTATATSFVGDASGVTGVGVDRIFKPGITSPTDNETISTATPTLSATCFVSTVGSSHCCTCFQVSQCSDFSANNDFTCNIAGGCTSITVPASCLCESTQYFTRLRYEDEDGCCSDFSDTICFCIPNLFATLGESICGGFYMGTICAAGTCYYLVMAPNATGCASCQYKTSNTCAGVCAEQCDGYGNTYDHLNSSEYPAGNFTATRTINGFSDWYLPAICEVRELFNNQACAPAGEGFDCGSICYVWSSTEQLGAPNAYSGIFAVAHGAFSEPAGDLCRSKSASYQVRAIRRVAFP